MNDTDEIYNRAAYERARKKVKEIKGVYINLMCYCITIPILIFINLKFSPGFHWFWFSALGWGSGVLVHGLAAFAVLPPFGREWEERKMKELIEKENRDRAKYQ